jgi:hypothetical protein
MNKLKSIGISALAGTLVSLSAAQAGGVSVSGSYELTYTNLDHDEVSGSKLGVNKNISFGAGGDISDGGAVTWATNIGWSDAAAISSASIAINMGGIATLTYDSGGGGTGANAVDNIVPTAWEEVDYGFATGISDVGVVSATKGVVNLTVKAPVAGTGFSLSYATRLGAGHVGDSGVSGGPGEAGHKGVDLVLDFVDYDAAHFGVRWGVAAQTEIHKVTCTRGNNAMRDGSKSSDESGAIASCNGGVKHNPYAGTMFTKLQLGPLHFGTQATFKNHATTKASAIMNQRSIVGGAALVFGDTLSLSYGVAMDKYRYNNRNRGLSAQVGTHGTNSHAGDASRGPAQLGGENYEYETQKYEGWSAALNLGPVALKGTRNHVRGRNDSRNNIYALGDTHSEINLSIAF